MKTKSLLTALALPAIFAACTNEELVESIENQQPIQEIVGADLVNKGLSINVGSGVESRMTADGDWTLTDKLGLGWLDAVGNITATQSPTGTSTDAKLYANHMFQKAEEGGDFTTYGNVYEGYHFAYYPYARMNKVEAKTIANVNVKQTEAFETDKYNKALWLSPQIYLTASDVNEDRLDTKKSFALNRVVNVLHVRTAIDQAILDETALTALSFSSVTADLNGKAAFSLNANLNPRLLPVATYNEKKGEMVLDKEWTVENLVGVNSNFAIDRGSAATLTTEVEGDFASLSNSSISVRMFTLPTFNVSVAATDVTFTFTTGAGYFTVKYTPTKDAAGKDVQLTAIQETNNDAIEKLLAFLSKEGFQKDEKSYTLQGFLGNSYPSLDFTLDKSMFTPDYSDIQSETDWNACVAIANALGNDDVTFNVTKSFAFAGEIQTPNVKNFYVTTAQGKAITVGTAEGITWPEEIKVPTTTQGSSLSVIVAKDAVLNVEGTEEAPATMNATSIANKGIINVNAWGAVSDNKTSALDNSEGRVVVEYGAYVYPKTNKEGIIAYVVDNTEKENIAKINILIKENNSLGNANVNTLVVKTDMDLNALAADEIANDRYENGSIATYLSDLKNIDIELEGGSLSKVLEGTNNTVNNVTATAGENVLNCGVNVKNNIIVEKNAVLTIAHAEDDNCDKFMQIKDLYVNGTMFVNRVMKVDNIYNTKSGYIEVANQAAVYYKSAYQQDGGAKGTIEKSSIKVIKDTSALQTETAAGKDVILADDVTISKNNAGGSNGNGATGINQNGGIIDGAGNTFGAELWGTWDSAICTSGGIIKNLTVNAAMRGIFVYKNTEKVILDNVIIDGTVYTISCDTGSNGGLEATNCTFNGWTSYAATIGEVKFVDCNFGEGQGYAYCRPYAPTSFVGCEFEEGFEVDARAKVTFENCTLNGVALTADNLSTLVTSNTANATVK